MTKTERDAARYRWLRNKSLAHAYGLNTPAVFKCDDDLHIAGLPIDGLQLDRAIDTAMELEPVKCHSENR